MFKRRERTPDWFPFNRTIPRKQEPIAVSGIFREVDRSLFFFPLVASCLVGIG